jgi:hypothetical protein
MGYTVCPTVDIRDEEKRADMQVIQDRRAGIVL